MGFRKRAQVLCLAAVFAVLTAMLAGNAISANVEQGSCMLVFLYGTAALLSLLPTLLCLDIWHLNPADSHTLQTLYSQYKFILLLRLRAPYTRWLIHKKTLNPRKTGEESLLNILKANENTTYGKEYNFKGIKTRHDFIKGHPLTQHNHYIPYVDKIYNTGEKDVLHKGGSVALICTSGTTGKSKVYPFCGWCILDVKFWLAQVCPLSYFKYLNLQRYHQFHIYSPVPKSPGGAPMAPTTQLTFQFPPHSLVPIEYSKLHKEDQSYYAQGLFSLAEKEMKYISGYSADLMYAFWKFVIANWENFCKDIENGYIGDHINMPSDVKTALSSHLKKDPRRAAELSSEIKLGTKGIAKRIWPDIEFILMAKNAGFKLCADILEKEHFEGIEIIDFAHGATEGLLGINLRTCMEDDDNAFTLVLFNSMFTEFIPVANIEEEQPQTVQAEDVKVGELYEIVTTNCNGLYRIRFGDVVEIVGFTNATPKYTLVYKTGQRLNIAYERTPDHFLIQAVQEVTKDLPGEAKLVDFTSVESILVEKITGKESKGHYVFFMEFSTDQNIGVKLLGEQDLSWLFCSFPFAKIDQALSDTYQQYKRFKISDSIGPVEVIQVRTGTFAGIKSYIWKDPHGQFKMPHVLRREPALKYLLAQALNKT